MKTNLRHLLLCAALAGLLPLSHAAREDAPAPAKTSSAADSPAVSTPAATTAAPAAAAPNATATATAPAAEPPAATPAASAPAADASASTSSLRRLDAPAAEDQAAANDDKSPTSHRSHGVRHNSNNDRVNVGSESRLNKGESANSVVAIAADAVSEGEVSDSVVAVAGDAHVTGPVSNAVVAVLGDAHVDAKVGQVVCILGDIDLGPNAEVYGDVINIGGDLKRDPKSVIHGSVPSIRIGSFHGNYGWAQSYLTNCLLKGRPLAIAPQLGWVWSIALGFFVFYVLLSLLFGGAVEKTALTLETRPGGSILASVLTLLLTPILFVLLCVTVVGIAVVPFLVLGMVVATLFGKAVMLAWIGRRVTRLFGDGPLSKPVFAVLIGGVIVLALYLVPFVGFIVYKLLGFLGLGVVVYTLLLASKREKAAPAPVAAGIPAGVSAMTATTSPATENMTGFAPTGVAPLVAPVALPAAAVPPVSATTLPRAGFWLRMAALAIDVILVGVVLGIIPRINFGMEGFLVSIAAYGAVLWKLKGTSIGGIICGLRVVRLDGREIDWATSLVRALSCFISLFVAGLGFIWIAIDDEKQAWHDKIAGTAVVLVRGGQSLV